MSRFASTSSSNDNLLALINLMASPDQFREKLAQLVETEKELDAKIALAGQAEEIVAIRQSLEEQQHQLNLDKEQAQLDCQELLSNAQTEAKIIIDTATANASQIIASANQKLEEAGTYATLTKLDADEIKAQATSNAETRLAELNEKAKELKQKEVDLDARENDVITQQTQVDSQWVLIDQAIADLERRSKRIESLEAQAMNLLKDTVSGFKTMQKEMK